MSQPSEQYRTELLQRLRARYGEPKSAAELEALRPQERAAEASARVVIARLEAGLPKADLCPYCWYLKGIEVMLEPIDSPDPRFIRMYCPTCGYSEDREVES